MSKYPLNDHIAALPASVPFVGAETSERELGEVFKARIGANENGHGPSPKVLAAMQNAASQIWMYGDSESHDLRRALADFHGVAYENIVVGEGIDGLLGYVCKLFVAPGRQIVTSEGGYPTFNFSVANNGGNLHFVPLVDDGEDIAGLLAKAREVEATLIYMSNPNNPMGSCHASPEVSGLIDKLPKNSVLILDEAYIEFAPAGTAPEIDVTNRQVLRFRTFSKAYAMAGARVGYCIGEAGLIAQMEKVRNHFGMNRMAQAGALAALEDQEYLQDILTKNANGRQKLEEIALRHGLVALPSATNFVAIDCGRDGVFARKIVDRLMQKSVFIRMPGVAPQSRCIRVSVGTKEAMALFENEFAQTLRELA